MGRFRVHIRFPPGRSLTAGYYEAAVVEAEGGASKLEQVEDLKDQDDRPTRCVACGAAAPCSCGPAERAEAMRKLGLCERLER